MSPVEVIRYVITNLTKDGMRTLTEPCQGRYTYPTPEEAQRVLELFKPSLREKVLGDRADTLEVRPVECWETLNGEPGDPKYVWFDLKPGDDPTKQD